MPSIESIKSVFKSSPNACLILHPDAPKYTIAHANDVFLKVTGSTLQDITGHGVFEVFSEGADDLSLKRKKVLKGCFEHALLLKKPHKEKLQRYDIAKPNSADFDIRFWNADTYPILDEFDNVQFLVHSPADVTEFVSEDSRLPLENEILINKNFQHPLFNDYPDGVATIDLYGNFLSVNDIFCSVTETGREALLQVSFIKFIALEDFQKVFDIFQKAMRGEIQNFETRILTATGRQRVLNITNLPIIDKTEVIGVYLIAKDITEMLESRQQIDQYNQRISTILESITDGFLATDSEWVITYFNKEAEFILGVKRGDVIGKSLWQVFPDAVHEKFYPEYHRALSDQVSVRFNEYVPRLNLWLEVTAYPSGDGLAAYFRDTTQKINADFQIRESRERYQALFDFSPLAKWVYDAESLRFLAVNEVAIRQYGYSLEEFLSMTIRDIWPEQDLPVLEEMLASRVKTRQRNAAKARHRKKSGEIVDVEIESQPLPSWGADARIIIAVDVTEKLKVEQALINSEKRFKALVQEGSDLIAIVDALGRYIYVSPTYKRILGLDPEDLLGRDVFETIYEGDKEKLVSQLTKLKPGQSVQIQPFRRFDGNNQIRWLETVVTDLTSDPAVGGIVINSRDVTQRIQNEKKIRESIDHYHEVSKTTTDAIYDWDFTTNRVAWGEGLNTVFGHEQSGARLTESWFQLIHPDDRDRVVDALVDHLNAKRAKWRIEYRFRAADRNFRSVQDRGFFIFDDAGQPERMIGALKDVSERVNYLTNIEGFNQRLGEISWMQSHVVRAPLARIMGLSELLRYNEGEITQKELLAHLTDSANELDEIIRNILQQTKGI
jgi:PAS domain S-box-containing protein